VTLDKCRGICKRGITVNEISLTSSNDILVKGTCNECKGQVARLIELGEDETFYKKAMDFRHSKRNQS
jgi:hypothetical protein